MIPRLFRPIVHSTKRYTHCMMPVPAQETLPRPPLSPSTPDRPVKKVKVDDIEVSTSLPLDTAPTVVLPAVENEAELVEEQMSLPFEYTNVYEREIEYRNQLVLAPMVRTGSLPMRLLSLHYGAGLVWSPEVVDKAIIGAERKVDPNTGVISYVRGESTVFTTHPMEKPYLIFQIGSSDPELALKAAQTVQQDVSGIDLNCGCPKPFSTHSGMGAALLSTPDTLLSILRILLANIPLPISCKIRLLPTQPSTLYLVSRILRTGIRNLTVHCRTRDMRPRERALWERLADLVALGKRRGVSITCNGDSEGWSNWDKIREETHADSVMIARAAERNPSVFLPTGPKCNITEVVPKLLNIAEYIDNAWGNTKFLLNQFRPSGQPISDMSKAQRREAQEAVSRGKSVKEVAENLGVELGKGREILDQIARELRERQPSNVFEARKEAMEEGIAVDEQVSAQEEEAIKAERKVEAEAGQLDEAALALQAEEEALNA